MASREMFAIDCYDMTRAAFIDRFMNHISIYGKTMQLMQILQ